MKELDEDQLMEISFQAAAVIRTCREISLEDLEAWAAHAHRQASIHDVLAPIVDPTAWQREYAGINAMARVAKAVYDFRQVIEGAVRR